MIPKNKTKNLNLDKIKVNDLLAKFKINPVNVIVVKNNELVTGDDVLDDDDEIKILSVVSGG